MPRYVAFLRAINVGGRNVTMKDLRSHFEALGFSAVETFIASGNVIFEAASRNAAVLERKIAKHLRASLGYEVATFVRSDSEVAEIARSRPFGAMKTAAAPTLVVGLLPKTLNAEETRLLAAFRSPIDDFKALGREVYWLCLKKQSESDFSNNVFEKSLKVKTTFRGIKTLQKLAAKLSEAGSASPSRKSQTAARTSPGAGI